MVTEPAKDYVPPNDDVEEVVLTRWEKCQKWWSIIMAVKKTVIFLLGFGAVSVAGNINGMNYWKEAAFEVGLMNRPVVEQPDPIEAPVGVQSVPEHTHPHEHELVWPKHTHPLQKHSHPEYALKDHVHAIPMPELKATIAAEVEKLLPENHKGLH